MSKIFEHLVGQEAAKRQLLFYLDGFKQTRIIPNLMLNAPRGTGKTVICRALARGMAEIENEKKLIEINSSTIKSVGKFFDSIVNPYMVGQKCTVFFDEASDLPKLLETALLTILQPNDLDCNEFVHDGVRYTFNFRDHTFLFATTQLQKVNRDLLDRLTKVTLEEYSREQLGQIVLKKLKNVAIDSFLLDDIAGVLRANPRSADLMGKEIRRYLTNKGKSEFTQADWEDLKNILNIYPLGLTELEVTVLRYLGHRELTTLTMLSSKLGMVAHAVQRDVELFLLKNDLIEIQPKGRCLTRKGMQYLEDLE